MSGRQLAVYSRGGFAEEAIEVGARRRLCLGGSWRYIAGGLHRGGYRSRGTEKTVAGRQLAVYSWGGFAEEAIEVGARRRLCLGGSWRYIAGGLHRGSYRSRGTEKTVAGRHLAVYSRGALQRRGGRGGGGGGEERRKDGRKLRNLTTPHRVVGNKNCEKTHERGGTVLLLHIFSQVFEITSRLFSNPKISN